MRGGESGVATNRSVRIAVVLAVGVLSFAFAPIFVRWADDAPGLAIAVWRTVIAAGAVVPLAALRSREEIRQFHGRDVLLIAAAGVFLGLHFIAWIESLYHTTVASASVLVTTSPIFLAVLGYLLIGDRLSARTVAAIGVAVAGAVLIGWGDAGRVRLGRGALFGNSLALGAAVLVSVYLLIGRVVRQKVSWLAYVAPLYAAAAATAVAAAWWQGVPLFSYSWTFYALCAGLAIGPQLAGHGSFNYAVQYLPAAIVGMLALFEPVGASILAYLLFGEVPPAPAIAGMAVVMAGVAIVVWERRQGEG
jgi:drug/metabolite transporter (DMT)-like permease